MYEMYKFCVFQDVNPIPGKGGGGGGGGGGIFVPRLTLVLNNFSSTKSIKLQLSPLAPS